MFEKIDIFTENSSLTEEQFLYREFGLKVNCVNPQDSATVNMLTSSRNLCIATTNLQPWCSVLNLAEKDTVVVILLGNETYDVSVYETLLGHESIRHAFIYGLPTVGKFLYPFGALVGELLDTDRLTKKNSLQALRNARTGLRKLNQFKKFSFNFPVDRFPQGYSNSFAIQTSRMIGNLNDGESLVWSNSVKRFFAKRKTCQFGFVGQFGSERRQWVINRARSQGVGVFEIRDGYGGNNAKVDNAYVSMLIKSSISLIPPGAFNSLNHRYLEALVANSLPLVVANVATDAFVNDNWSRNLSLLPRYSYRKLLSYSASLSELTRKNLVNELQVLEFERLANQIKQVRQVIDSGDARG